MTGAGRGLGRAYASRLAGLGADIVVNDVRLDSTKEFGEPLTAESVTADIEALGRRSLGIEADVSDRSQVREMFERVLETFGRIDILVNNAGGLLTPVGRSYPSSVPEEDLRSVLSINVLGTIYCCQVAADPVKRQRYGRIVNVSSLAGLGVYVPMARGRGSQYGVAKAGIIQYTRELVAELGPMAYGSMPSPRGSFAPRVATCSTTAAIRPSRSGGRSSYHWGAWAHRRIARRWWSSWWLTSPTMSPGNASQSAAATTQGRPG